MKKNNLVGIIGGSGLDKLDIVKEVSYKRITTPYGKTSGQFTFGKVNGASFVSLARHGERHLISPTRVPYRANLWALKKVGCTRILATTACGSLNNKMRPGDFVFIDQFIDFTRFRNTTFFDKKVVHTQMADPFDFDLRKKLIRIAKKLSLSYHPSGTMVTIEGPRFSTRAESLMFRKIGADLINMSTVPEVTLANELNIPYQSIAMVTDYDSWKYNEIPVSYDLILERMKQNSENVKKLLIRAVIELSK